jgi:septal ring factor EnvC (AmiA/AmiB activator)
LADKKENRVQGWGSSIWCPIRRALFEEDPRDIISSNAKSVLIGLFILIGLAIIFYAITVSLPHFADTSKQSKNISRALSQLPTDISSVNNRLQKEIDRTQQLQNNIAKSTESNNNVSAQLQHALEIVKLIQNQTSSLTQTQSFIGNLSQIDEEFTDLQRRDQQLEVINSVFIAAIAGALALGGTLITQLWGRKD